METVVATDGLADAHINRVGIPGEPALWQKPVEPSQPRRDGYRTARQGDVLVQRQLERIVQHIAADIVEGTGGSVLKRRQRAVVLSQRPRKLK